MSEESFPLQREPWLPERLGSPLAGVFYNLFLQPKINETDYGLIYKLLCLPVYKNPG